MGVKKPFFCQSCPLYEVGEGYLPKPSGPHKAKVILVGESLSKPEVESGILLSGKAGAWFSSLLRRHGITREDFLIDKVLRCAPPWQFPLNGPASFCPSQEGHLNETLKGSSAKVIVSMGQVATQHCLGLPPGSALQPHLGYPQWSSEFAKWVVPTYDPSFLWKGNQHLSGVFAAHVVKAVKVAKGGPPVEAFPPTLSDPSLPVALQWVEAYEHALAKAPDDIWLSFDIETPYKSSAQGDDEGELVMDDPSYTILRIAFAFQGSSGLSLSWSPHYLQLIKRLLGSATPKLLWNSSYDVPRVEANGMEIGGETWDIMNGWHLLNSDIPKGLAFVAALTTNLPKWKHLSGEDAGKYNAIDAVATVRIAQVVVEDLKKQGQWDIFQRHIVALDKILDKMHRTGIALDDALRHTKSEELEKALDESAQIVNATAPLEAKALHPKGGFARPPKVREGLIEIDAQGKEKVCVHCGEVKPKKAHWALHGLTKPELTLNFFPERRFAKALPFIPSNAGMIRYASSQGHSPIVRVDKQTGKRRPSFDDDALKALLRQHPADPLYQEVRRYRGVEKEMGYVGKWDEEAKTWKGGVPVGKDGRVHTIFTHVPSTLRLSSQVPNMQNCAPSMRDLYVADPGYLLLESDFSSIEAVLVGYLANSEFGVRIAKLGIHDFLNSHILARAGKIGKPAEASWSDNSLREFLQDLKMRFPEERQRAKVICHGVSYGMQPGGMWRRQPETFTSEKEAASLKALFFEVCPWIPKWQESVVLKAEEEAELRNPFGYLHRFWNVCSYRQMPDGEWRRSWSKDAEAALAFAPQSTAAGIIKDVMLDLEEKEEMASKGWLLLQVHDSLVLRIPEKGFDTQAEKVVNSMTRPSLYLPLPWEEGKFLQIGVESKVGKRWGKAEMTKWP